MHCPDQSKFLSVKIALKMCKTFPAVECDTLNETIFMHRTLKVKYDFL